MANKQVTLRGGPLDGSTEIVREGAAYIFLALVKGRRGMMGEEPTDAAIYKESGIGYSFERLASEEAHG